MGLFESIGKRMFGNQEASAIDKEQPATVADSDRERRIQARIDEAKRNEVFVKGSEGHYAYLDDLHEAARQKAAEKSEQARLAQLQPALLIDGEDFASELSRQQKEAEQEKYDRILKALDAGAQLSLKKHTADPAGQSGRGGRPDTGGLGK